VYRTVRGWDDAGTLATRALGTSINAYLKATVVTSSGCRYPPATRGKGNAGTQANPHAPPNTMRAPGWWISISVSEATVVTSSGNMAIPSSQQSRGKRGSSRVLARIVSLPSAEATAAYRSYLVMAIWRYPPATRGKQGNQHDGSGPGPRDVRETYRTVRGSRVKFFSPFPP